MQEAALPNMLGDLQFRAQHHGEDVKTAIRLFLNSAKYRAAQH